MHDRRQKSGDDQMYGDVWEREAVLSPDYR
jgi:hypothetical protein